MATLCGFCLACFLIGTLGGGILSSQFGLFSLRFLLYYCKSSATADVIARSRFWLFITFTFFDTIANVCNNNTTCCWHRSISISTLFHFFLPPLLLPPLLSAGMLMALNEDGTSSKTLNAIIFTLQHKLDYTFL